MMILLSEFIDVSKHLTAFVNLRCVYEMVPMQ